MSDHGRLARRIERQTGATITLKPYEGEKHSWTYIQAVDPELGGRLFVTLAHTERQIEDRLRETHEQIYYARGRAKYEMQCGKCAHCGKDLRSMGEIDHILSRGAHGRDDKLSNLQVVCPPFTGGCDFHRQKHGQAPKETFTA